MTKLEETDTCGSFFFKDFEKFLQNIYSKFFYTDENENMFDDVDVLLNDDIYSVKMKLSNTLLHLKPLSSSIPHH